MLRHSLRDARRLLMRDRGLTAVVLLTLTLGIGANTIVFSLLHGVLLSPLPYPAPERLVRIFETHPEFPKFPMSPGNFLEFRRDTRAFEHIAVFTRADLQLSGGPRPAVPASSGTGSSDTRPERLAAMQVSAEYFPTLGVTPVWGRLFHEDDMRPDHRVIILSDRLWRRRFNADPTIVGRDAPPQRRELDRHRHPPARLPARRRLVPLAAARRHRRRLDARVVRSEAADAQARIS